MVGMAEVGAPISQDGVAVHPDCWCVCLCYLYFTPENPEDGKNIMMDTAQVTCGMSKDHAGIRKHGGGMRKLLKHAHTPHTTVLRLFGFFLGQPG